MEAAKNAVRDQVAEFIVTNFLFGDEGSLPTDEESLIEQGVVDSTGILELIEFIEKQFGISIKDTETVPENLGSVANITKFVQSKKA